MSVQQAGETAMLCENCQEREATVHMTKIINGNKTEMNLCEVCAQKDNSMGLGFEPNWMLHNIFAELFNQSLTGGKALQVNRTRPVQCDQCGFTDKNFSEVGKLGCPRCYEIFQDKLEPLLRRIHGNSVHTGKIPKRSGSTIGLKKEIETLKQKLQEAVSREEYELAAEIRDKIRGIESKLE